MSRSDNSRRGSASFPRIRHPGFSRDYVRPASKRQRAHARRDLARGAEPEPYRPRRSERYYYW